MEDVRPDCDQETIVPFYQAHMRPYGTRQGTPVTYLGIREGLRKLETDDLVPATGQRSFGSDSDGIDR